MSETLTLEQVPAELKAFWNDEAKRNARSLSEEIVRALEEAQLRRDVVVRGGKKLDEVLDAVHRLQSLVSPDDVLDDKILYGDDGMPI